MPPLRFGILGAAKIADRYTIPAMQAVAGVDVVALAARDPLRAAALAEKHGLRAFPTYEDVLLSPEVDAVYLPLPISLHRQWALASLAAGKHVLCEKSLTGSLADAEEILAAARLSKTLVAENFMCERHPQNTFVRNRIAEGEIGELRNTALSFGFPAFARDDLRNSAALEGGALNDAGAYCLAMALFYSQAAPTEVWATSQRLDYEVDVVGAALVRFADDSTASISYGFGYDYRNEARFWGSTGQIDIDRPFSIPPDRMPDVRLTRNTEVSRYDLPAANHFELQVADFAERVRTGRRDDVLVKLRRQAVVMEATRKSSDENRVVRLAEFGAWPLLDDVSEQDS